MRKLLLITLCAALPFAAGAQEMDHSAMGHDMPMQEQQKMPEMDHSKMGEGKQMKSDTKMQTLHNHQNLTTSGNDVQFDKEISTYKRDAHGQPTLNNGPIPMHDNEVFYTFQADRFEQRFQDGDDVTLWDVRGWIGEDYNKLFFKSEGDYNTDKGEYESTRNELLYSRNVAPFWDVQAGLRHDFINNADDRSFAALGLQGLAPYWFEVEATTYVSDEGDISARIEGEYDLLLTQRLILQPRFETELALQDVPEYNIGSGINDIELGVRMRYEFSRKFAPYIGVEWTQAIGETKNMIEASGEDPSNTAVVAGVKFWF